MRNQSNKRPSTLIYSNNINNFFFDETKSWTSFGKKFADFRYVLMKFLIFFHCETSVNMSNPNVIFYRLCISRLSMFLEEFSIKFMENMKKFMHFTENSPHYWISQRTWRFFDFFLENAAYWKFSINFQQLMVDFFSLILKISTSRKILEFFCHYAATNCCIFATLIEIFFRNFYRFSHFMDVAKVICVYFIRLSRFKGSPSPSKNVSTGDLLHWIINPWKIFENFCHFQKKLLFL